MERTDGELGPAEFLEAHIGVVQGEIVAIHNSRLYSAGKQAKQRASHWTLSLETEAAKVGQLTGALHRCLANTQSEYFLLRPALEICLYALSSVCSYIIR